MIGIRIAINNTNIDGLVVKYPIDRLASTAVLKPKYPFTRPIAVPFPCAGKIRTAAVTAVEI